MCLPQLAVVHVRVSGRIQTVFDDLVVSDVTCCDGDEAQTRNYCHQAHRKQHSGDSVRYRVFRLALFRRRRDIVTDYVTTFAVVSSEADTREVTHAVSAVSLVTRARCAFVNIIVAIRTLVASVGTVTAIFE